MVHQEYQFDERRMKDASKVQLWMIHRSAMTPPQTVTGQLLSIEEPRRAIRAPAEAAVDRSMPLLRLGFRPFYLLAGLAAAVLPALWLATLAGVLAIHPALPASLWHGHEMIFGVVIAAIVGFLFTAGRLWTGQPTPTGALLGAFALLWLAARIAALTGPYALFAWLDGGFLPLAAAVFFAIVLRSKNWRNLPMALLLTLLAAANLVFHAAQAGVLPVQSFMPGQALQAAVLLIVAVMSVVAGRVIPAFIGNAVPGSRPRINARVEHAVLPGTALILVLWLGAPGAGWTAAALFIVAALHLLRLALWRPWDAWGRPILWVLPLAYAWIPAGLALLGGASLGLWPASIGIHALAAGAMGALIVGMMSRTARGHTGRRLQPGRREVWAYRFVLAGALVRVVAPLVGEASLPVLALAAALWSGAFALILWTLAPWLVAPRLDGKPG
jgi:uncharacterized protein involved in response to NO